MINRFCFASLSGHRPTRRRRWNDSNPLAYYVYVYENRERGGLLFKRKKMYDTTGQFLKSQKTIIEKDYLEVYLLKSVDNQRWNKWKI